MNISGYNSLRSDHSSNIKRRGVCMFYKDYLPVIICDDLCPLSECIVTEVKFGKKSIFFTCNYRSPSQTPDEVENNYQNFHFILSSIEDTSLASLTFAAGYTQLINKLTQFFSGGSSCIDLISCNKPKSLKNLLNAESTILFFKHVIMTLFLQRSVIIFPFPEIKIEKFGTTKMSMMKEYKIPYPFEIGKKLLKIYQLMRKLVFFTTLY